MTVLGIMESPRIGGNSDLLLDRALDGAEAEKIILTKLRWIRAVMAPAPEKG
jgi:multimeric flavodoxin WrbA